MQLEWHLSKREILTLYLNRARLAVRCRGSVRQVGLISENRCEFKLFRGGNAGGVAASAQPLRPDRWPERAEAARNKVLERWPCKVCGPVSR